jgi:hypothetical protein
MLKVVPETSRSTNIGSEHVFLNRKAIKDDLSVTVARRRKGNIKAFHHAKLVFRFGHIWK